MKIVKSFFSNYFYSLKISYISSRKFFVLKFIISILLSFLPFVSIYIWRNIINILTNIDNNNNIKFLIINIIVYLVFYLLMQALGRISEYVGFKYNDRITIFIENIMIEKFAEVDLAFYDSSKLMDKLNRAGDIKYSIISMSDTVFWTLQNSISFIIALVLLAKLNILYVILILILSLPIFILKIRVNKMNNTFGEKNVNLYRKMNYYKGLFRNINSSFDIRIFNLKDFFLDKYVKTWEEWYKRSKKNTFKATGFTLISLLISTFINQILLYLLIIEKLAKNIINLGDAIFFISVFNEFYNSTMSLISTLSHAQNAFLQISTVKEFLDLEPMIQKSGILEPKEFKEITFSHVCFKYPGKDDYILDDCTFTIKRGQTIGLVGENGSGKSTIVKLLLRLYDVNDGQILLDGIDIKEYDIVKYRAIFSVLFQDFIKYSFSLRENVALSDYLNMDNDKRINDAISKSELDDLIIDWEKGLETSLTRYFDSDGKELSGGQWQRVALARVFFSDRNFIVLDEPSASLDVFAEEKIFKQFEQLSNNRSSLIISHRLSSIINADIIIVLNNGKIIEKGSHKELLVLNGYYAELFNLQAKRYIQSPAKQ